MFFAGETQTILTSNVWIAWICVHYCNPAGTVRCQNQIKKKTFIFSIYHFLSSSTSYLRSVTFLVTWLMWACKIKHEKRSWISLSLPSFFQAHSLSHERQWLPIMPVYGLHREELYCCMTGVCVYLWDLTGNMWHFQLPHCSPWQVQVCFV